MTNTAFLMPMHVKYELVNILQSTSLVALEIEPEFTSKILICLFPKRSFRDKRLRALLASKIIHSVL